MKLLRAIQQYGAMKQRMGISFKEGMKVLQTFRGHMGDRPVRSILKWHVLAFLDRSILSDVTWLLRYRVLRAFFEYRMVRGELSELPMPIPRQPGTPRAFVPFIYSVLELKQLLHYAAQRRPATRANGFGSHTFCALLLFLYGTGSRINETLALKYKDVDLRRGTVTFRPHIRNRTRTIPIDKHLCESLKKYAVSIHRGDFTHFFVGRAGRAIRPNALTVSFQTIRGKSRIARQAEFSRQPRLQDFRRTFAVHCMRSWLQEGKDLRSMLPVLGAYLGHVSPVSTEAYLSVTPERFWKQLSQLGSASV